MAAKEHRKPEAASASGVARLLAEGLSDPDARVAAGDDRPDGVGPQPRLPDYESLKELHRGGQGVVYSAVQQTTRRKVAIKVLLHGAHASWAARRRFEREVELAARLRHPHITTVHHTGETPEGLPYFVMDYVDGLPLDAFVREAGLPLEETLSLFATICEATQFAHQRGIIHRDLKPSNILVDGEGEPHILDFGLAKLADERPETLVSVGSQVFGTLPYMSPEQVRGDTHGVGTHSDVYALGVILYELMAGAPPYPTTGPPQEVLRHIAETPPAPLSRSASSTGARSGTDVASPALVIPDDVQRIALKALAKEPERRYQSAGDLGRDIRRFLAGEPIEARADSFTYILRRRLRRHRAAAIVACLFAAVVTVGLVVTVRLAVGLANSRSELEWTVYVSGLGGAQAALQTDDGGRALTMLERCDPSLRAWEWHWLMSRADQATATVTAHSVAGFRRPESSGVRGLAFDARTGRLFSAGQDGLMRVWTTRLSAEAVPSHWQVSERPMTAMVLSPSEALALVTSEDGTARVWDTADGVPLGSPVLVNESRPPLCACFFPDGSRAVTGGADGFVRIWSPRRMEELERVSTESSQIRAVAVSPSGDLVGAGYTYGGVAVWDTRTYELVWSDDSAHEGGAEVLMFAPRESVLLTAGADGKLRSWNTGTFEPIYTTQVSSRALLAGAIAPSCRLLALGGADGAVRMVDMDTGRVTRVFLGHRFPVNVVCFDPQGQHVFTGSAGGIVKTWSLAPPQDVVIPSQCGTEIAWSCDARYLVAGDSYGRVELWDMENRKCLWIEQLHVKRVLSVLVSTGYVISTGHDGTVHVSGVDGEPVRTFRGHSAAVTAAVYAPPDDLVLSADTDGVLCAWEASTGRERAHLKVAAAGVGSLAIDPSCRLLAIGAMDGGIECRRLPDLAVALKLVGHRSKSGSTKLNVTCLEFDSGGDRLASSGQDDVVRMWDVRDGALLWESAPQPFTVRSVSISMDGRTVASAGADATVRLYNGDTGRELLVLPQIRGVNTVAFSPDGRYLAYDLPEADGRTGQVQLLCNQHMHAP